VLTLSMLYFLSLLDVDILCNGALLSGSDGELHLLPLLQSSVSGASNAGEVDKDIITRLSDNEAEALTGIEPLDSSSLARSL